LSIFRSTALNPIVTVPLYIASLYTAKGRDLAIRRPLATEWLKALSILSVMRSISKFLDKGVMNNWTNDVYDWKKETVVVTGGSDGIGALVVQLLAKRGIRVVVLDIQRPKYEGGYSNPPYPIDMD
jgi:all-trans-retinol dehydrogenase (NAD+)